MGAPKLLPVFLAALLLSACGRPGAINPPTSLAIPINLKCTTCDDFIRCAASTAQADPATGRVPVVVYRLREKTFWAQIATIGDYLTQFLREKTADERPYSVYTDTGTARNMEYAPDARARIDTVATTIRLRQESIDQRSGVWRGQGDVLLGQCVAMPRKQGYALVREYLGKPALGSGAPR